MGDRKTVRYYLPRLFLAAVSGVVALAAAWFVFGDALEDRLRARLVQFAFDNLSEEQLQELYASIGRDTGQYWDIVPEPRVARIGQRGVQVESKGTTVRINNAGMRASHRYGPKRNTYRIVCLGDSFVMGTGGAEEDRFCDQMGQFYRDREIRIDGKPIETMAVALGGWTLLQSVTYLTSRLSAYEPDLVLLMPVANDITDNWGVTGRGAQTGRFSPEARQWGSGLFSNQASIPFRQSSYTVLTFDLTPESRLRWSRAMEALHRLARLQERRGARMLVTVLDNRGGLVADLFRAKLGASPDSPPFVTTGFFPDENVLPHDSHPNRRGHQVMASHFIHVLNQLGWIPVDPERLPELDERLSLELNPPPLRVERLQRNYVEHVFRNELDFADLKVAGMLALLGGIFPEKRREVGGSPPWASVRSGFVLRPPPEGSSALEVEIVIPGRIELFPFQVDAFINGAPAGSWTFAEPDQAGRHVLTAGLPAATYEYPATEVVLESRTYFTEIMDHRMKSFQLVRAGFR